MQRITDASAVALPPSLPSLAGLTAGYFTEGNPGGGVPATQVRAWWLNMVDKELENILVAAGIDPDATQNDQVITAINSLIADAVAGVGGGGGGGGGIDEAYFNLHAGKIAKRGLQVSWPAGSVVVADEYVLTDDAPEAGTITGGSYRVGSAGGSFDHELRINGVAVADLGTQSVSSATRTVWADGDLTAFAAGAKISFVVSNVVGNPTGAVLQAKLKVTF